MDTKHTPGPWGLFDGKSSNLNGKQIVMTCPPKDWQCIDLETGAQTPDFGLAEKTIAVVYEDTETFGKWTPNARLIASSPDLLAAVSAAIDIIERWNAGEDAMFGDVFEQLCAAETKAKG
ncbi:MAG: hypothetical protein Q7U34_00920 [Anaerolineales bacterium]|nr:hypothetical protein [Anaerolineales bacterium]